MKSNGSVDGPGNRSVDLVPEPWPVPWLVLWRVLSALTPAVLAVFGVATVAPATHDDGVVRTVGAGFTGALRALDLIVASPALLLPLGTRALRAGLASAVVTGVCGALAFDLAHDIARIVPDALRRVGIHATKAVSPRLLGAVATVAVLDATLSPAWQSEGAAPGGAVTGALLILAALYVGRRAQGNQATPFPSLAFIAGLLATYDPLALVAMLAGVAPFFVGTANVRRRFDVVRTSCGLGLGLMPLALGVLLGHRAPFLAFSPARGADLGAGLLPLAVSEVGMVFLVVGAAGAALALIVPEARRLVSSVIAVLIIATLGTVVYPSASPDRYSPCFLVAVVCVHALGVPMLGAVVVAIARARVPFAEISAALVVLLELVLPVRAADETMSRREGRISYAAAIWDDVAWGTAPPASVILVAHPRTMGRVASTRAVGGMRGDLVIVPAFDVQGRAGQEALAREPKLAPLYRDIALGMAPEELSLAQVGGQRAVMAAFDPSWDRALARHLVPSGLISRFEIEPRGASERKKGLEAFVPQRDELVRAIVAKKDPELLNVTTRLLRSRAIGMAATGERDVLALALDDLRTFSQRDSVEAALVRRMLTSKGPIDVQDLTP